MIAYKGTKNQKCINITYEPGKTYTLNGELKMCRRGFHFCKELKDIDKFYRFRDKDTQILEIEVLGKIIDDNNKSITDKFKVLRIIPKSEWSSLSGEIKYEFDKNNNTIYFKDSGFWIKYENDENNNKIYEQRADGFWKKYKYDKNNNQIYLENSNGFWLKQEYDNNNKIYEEHLCGFWTKYKYDKNNNLIYFKNSNGNKYQIEIS